VIEEFGSRGSDQKFGEYYVDVRIGGKTFALMLDTGSSDLALGAEGCKGCTKKTHHFYDPENRTKHNSNRAIPVGCDWCAAHASDSTSNSCKVLKKGHAKQCTYDMGYEDNSGFSAALYNDSFAFAAGDTGIKGLETPVMVGAMYKAKFDNPKQVQF